MNKGRFFPFLFLGLGTLTGVFVGLVAIFILNPNKEDSRNSEPLSVASSDHKSNVERFDTAKQH